MGVFLTYALNESGALVHVDDVANGAKCECHCPYCNAPLHAKMADIKESIILRMHMVKNAKEPTRRRSAGLSLARARLPHRAYFHILMSWKRHFASDGLTAHSRSFLMADLHRDYLQEERTAIGQS